VIVDGVIVYIGGMSFWSGGVPCAHIKFCDDQMKCTLSL
jgi:hypothetical protein